MLFFRVTIVQLHLGHLRLLSRVLFTFRHAYPPRPCLFCQCYLYCDHGTT